MFLLCSDDIEKGLPLVIYFPLFPFEYAKYIHACSYNAGYAGVWAAVFSRGGGRWRNSCLQHLLRPT